MKCPVCQAKLLPVDGELFCLQCGRSLHQASADAADDLHLEDTVDPVLQRAIRDAGDGVTQFAPPKAAPPKAAVIQAKQPAAAATSHTRPAHHAKPKRSFVSLHAILAAPRPLSSDGALVLGPSLPLVRSTHVAPETAAEVTHSSHAIVRAWTTGFAVFAVFMALNLAATNYYAQRVYPGVKLGGVAVGGWTFDELRQKLPGLVSRPTLAATVGSVQYPLEISDSSALQTVVVRRSIERSGRQAMLPIAGVVGSWFEPPVRPVYSLSDSAVDATVQQLAAEVDRAASDAFITTIDSNVFVVAEKPGVSLDTVAAAAAIRAAYGHTATVNLQLRKALPRVAAGDWAEEVVAAQTMIGQAYAVDVKKLHYVPSTAQIASWVVFGGPGKGVTADPAAVAAYVASIPGSFDRAATLSGLLAALNGHTGVALAASTKRVTANPAPASAAEAWPLMTYNYCIRGNDESAAALRLTAAKVLSSDGGWTMGGRIRYVLAKSSCNMMFQIGDAKALSQLDPACGKQSSCRIHNDLAINAANWAAAPATWTADIAAYRAELVNQVTGQWLGFDHASCTGGATVAEVLSTPSVRVLGCSMHWYPVPAELQDTKVLSGF
jgi:hypothetical protein